MLDASRFKGTFKAFVNNICHHNYGEEAFKINLTLFLKSVFLIFQKVCVCDRLCVCMCVSLNFLSNDIKFDYSFF